MGQPFAIRPARQTDLPFVLNSWLRNYHEHGDGARHVPNEVFFSDAGHHGVVTSLLATSTTLIACLPDDDDAICGWCCAEAYDDGRGVLHFVYVKAPYRRMGVGQTLLRSVGFPLTVCTHWTPVIRSWRERGRIYVYNPYLAQGVTP